MNILRNPGEYLEKQNLSKILNNILLIVLLLFFTLLLIFNYAINFFIKYNSIILPILIIIIFIISYFINKKGKELFKEIENNEKGIIGEKIINSILDELKSKYPNFYTLNDIQTKKIGNFDHIIICEKGIFIIETKNHKYINKKNNYYKKLKYNALILKKHLEKKFNINYIQGILVYINKNIKEEKNHIIGDKYIKKVIENHISGKNKICNCNINQTKEIYDYLIKIQNKNFILKK